MRNIFFASDTHYDHANILNFQDSEGKRFRGDLFSSVEEMNEVMIQNHNEVVKPGDLFYHLGDVTFKPNDFARIASRLNGKKRLIVGNHDQLHNYELTRWFEKISLWRLFKDEKIMFSHIPLMEAQFRHKVTHNGHGHIHQNESPGLPWINFCVEKTRYTPVSFDEVKDMIKARAYD